MTKLDLKSIASALAAAHNITDEDAEKFLKVLFDVIMDALRHDGQVKVKGLGTFKLIDVPEREMVDVNTGERIMVDARQRVSFTPDAVLRDIVNKPFMFFDTVVLNDGVVFDDESETEPEDSDDEDEQEEDNSTENTSEDTETEEEETADEESETENAEDERSEEPVEEETIETAEDTESSDNDEAAEEPAESEEPIAEETEEISETETPVEDNSSEESAETTDKAEPKTPEKTEETEEKPKQDETPSAVNEALENAKSIMDDIQSGNLGNDDDEPAMQHPRSENKIRKKVWIIFIIITVFASAVAFFFGLYAGGGEFNWSLNDDVATDTIVKADSIAADSVRTDSVKVDSVKTDSIKADTVVAVVTKTDSLNLTPSGLHKTTEIDPDFYDALDTRVRTGAYRIVGIAKVIKVKKGKTLKSLSDTYLGKGMECYVEALNGVESVKEGDELKIPKLEWRKKKK